MTRLPETLHAHRDSDEPWEVSLRHWQQRRLLMTVEALLAEKEVQLSDEEPPADRKWSLKSEFRDFLWTVVLFLLLLLGSAWLGGVL